MATNRKPRKKYNNAPSTPLKSRHAKKPESSKTPFFKLKLFRTGWKVGAVLVTIISGMWLFVESGNYVKDEYFTTEHKKFESDKYIKGIIIPYDVQRRYKEFLLINGNHQVYIPLKNLRQGDVKWPQMVECVHSDTVEMPLPTKLKLIGERLYVSAKFFDVDKKYVGQLDNEDWKLFKSQIADFNSGDRFLEVIDHYNNVLFSVVYEQENIIQIRGYSMGDFCASVCSPPGETGLHMFGAPDAAIRDSIIRIARKIKRIGPSKFENAPIN